MPLYVHEVEARVVPEAAAPAGAAAHGLRPEQFRALVAAVIRELERRKQQAHSLEEETAITGQNRPPSIGA
ncbi:MAG: hypothetical protein HY704_09575 [Gemmatimonadetes bacterium]|nr:hypothetical protein [Gemmatimonadota bacterium]